jgi:hypothetical protein
VQSDRSFTASGLGGFAAGWFTFGTLHWTSGTNAGRQAEVLAHEVADSCGLRMDLAPPVIDVAAAGEVR